MSMKHSIKDTDLHFVVDPSTRNIEKQYSGKAYIMQYDHNSESFTFEVPRYIEEHDMSLCDLIQVHYENASVGTSSSVRKIYRGVEAIVNEDVKVNDESIVFSWLVPDTATTFAGSLKFQLRFVCHDNEEEEIIGYRWHTNVNGDISIVAGLAYSEDAIPESAKATLQTLDVWETEEGVEFTLDGIPYLVKHGRSGVYVGSGEMPDNCNVQIDPEGEADPITKVIDLSTFESEGRIVETLSDDSEKVTRIEFDDDGNPTKVIDNDDNEIELVWNKEE